MKVGPKNLITDVPGLLVGNAQDHALKSGTTVLVSDAPFTASVHVMGGAPGSRETDLLAPDKSVAAVDALVGQTRNINRAVTALGVTGIEFEGSDSLDDPNSVFQ